MVRMVGNRGVHERGGVGKRGKQERYNEGIHAFEIDTLRSQSIFSFHSVGKKEKIIIISIYINEDNTKEKETVN